MNKPLKQLSHLQKRSDVAVKSFKYYDTTTKKQETVEFYDYFYHSERFSFEWEEVNLQFKYSVKLSDDKKINKIKKMSMDKQNRKLLCTDESRMWSLKLVGTTVQVIHSLTFAYLLFVPTFERSFKITTNDIKDLTKITIAQKNPYMRRFDQRSIDPNVFYTALMKHNTILNPIWNGKIRTIGANLYFYSFAVSKFYHDSASTNFLKFFNYKGKMKIRRSLGSFYEGTVYIYNKKDTNTYDINDRDQDSCFPDKYS